MKHFHSDIGGDGIKIKPGFAHRRNSAAVRRHIFVRLSWFTGVPLMVQRVRNMFNHSSRQSFFSFSFLAGGERCVPTAKIYCHVCTRKMDGDRCKNVDIY